MGVHARFAERIVDAAIRLDRDRALDPRELRARDRAIGLELDPEAGTDARIATWIERTRDGSERSPGRVAALGLAVAAAFAIVVGGAFGLGAAAVVFAYDGSEPVNVLAALSLFVGLQAVLVVTTVVAMIPGSIARILPGVRGLRDGLRTLGPGRILMHGVAWLPQRHREGVERATSYLRSAGTLHGEGLGLTALRLGQLFGVAFNVAALAWFLRAVFTTDLAFTWSSTVEIDAAALQRLTDVVSAPFAWSWPDARPSLELIESTRYFRLEGAASRFGESPSVPGRWWAFLAASMATWGLLPRAALAWVASRAARRALARDLLRLPGIDDVLERMARPVVATASDEPESAGGGEPETGGGGPSHARCAVVVRWAGAPLSDGALEGWLESAVGFEALGVYDAGGARSLEDDRATARRVAAELEAMAPGEPHGRSLVAVVVKSWEPPTLDLTDFLSELREAIGDRRPIVVVPFVERGAGGAPEHQREAWRHRVRAIGDPWTDVRFPAGPEVSP